MFRFALVVALSTAAACASRTTGTASGSAPQVVSSEAYDMRAAEWTATARGLEVVVDLHCRRRNARVVDGDVADVDQTPCETTLPVRLVLITPWGASVDGAIGDRRDAALPLRGARAVFAIDWSTVGVDPLADGAAARLGGAWTVAAVGASAEVRWSPSDAEATALLAGVGAAIGVETDVRDDQPAPAIEVGDLALASGPNPTLRLTVTNTGSGPAYRLYARTRSSEPALHGVQISFGRVAPGATETRSAAITLPDEPRRPVATVVLEFHEANANYPDTASRRVHVGAAIAAPAVTLVCNHATGRVGGGRVVADAGARLRLECTVRNDSNATAAGIRLRVSVGSRAVGATDAITLAAGQSQVVVVSVRVPRGATPDQAVPLVVRVEKPGGGRLGVERGSIEVRMPTLCPDGRITRAQYEAKRASLEAAVDSGTLTQEEFERYDAELVGCLR